MPKWKTRNDPHKAGFGEHYQQTETEYPYGAKSRPGGAAQIPQARSVDSMKAPVSHQYELGYERGLIEGKADAVKPWRYQAENWRKGYADGVAASRSQPLTTVEQHGSLITHKTAGTEGQIVGTYMDGKTGGFKVYVPKEDHTYALPFTQLDNWERVGAQGWAEASRKSGYHASVRKTKEGYEVTRTRK